MYKVLLLHENTQTAGNALLKTQMMAVACLSLTLSVILALCLACSQEHKSALDDPTESHESGMRGPTEALGLESSRSIQVSVLKDQPNEIALRLTNRTDKLITIWPESVYTLRVGPINGGTVAIPNEHRVSYSLPGPEMALILGPHSSSKVTPAHFPASNANGERIGVCIGYMLGDQSALDADAIFQQIDLECSILDGG